MDNITITKWTVFPEGNTHSGRCYCGAECTKNWYHPEHCMCIKHRHQWYQKIKYKSRKRPT